MNFHEFPLEIKEHILQYLNSKDLSSFAAAVENKNDYLSDIFWRKSCERKRVDWEHSHLSPQDTYWCSVNWEMPRCKVSAFSRDTVGTALYLNRSLLICCHEDETKKHKDNVDYTVYNLCSNMKLVQKLPQGSMSFKNDIILIKNSCTSYVYTYNNDQNNFILKKQINNNDLFSVSNICDFCEDFLLLDCGKRIYLYNFITECLNEIIFKNFVKFFFQKKLQDQTLFIITSGNGNYYRIQTFDLMKQIWKLDIECYNMGIIHDPHLIVTSKYIACIAGSFRRGQIYYEQIKVWDICGNEYFRSPLIPTASRIICSSEQSTVAFTNYNCVKVFSSFLNISTSVSLSDRYYCNIKLTCNRFLLVLYRKYCDIYDWTHSLKLHSVNFANETFTCNLVNMCYYIHTDPESVTVLDFTGNQFQEYKQISYTNNSEALVRFTCIPEE